jgi:hypothetical protein
LVLRVPTTAISVLIAIVERSIGCRARSLLVAGFRSSLQARFPSVTTMAAAA